MGLVVAVGVPGWPEVAGWDVTGLVATLAALLVVRFLIGIRLAPPTFVLAVLCGLLFPYAAGAWGLLWVCAGAFLLAATVWTVARRLPER